MSLKPTKSVYKGGLVQRAQPWSVRDELTRPRLLSLLCLALLPLSIGLYGAGISRQDLTISQGDSVALNFGQLGYSRICFQGYSGPLDCAHIDTSCAFSYSPDTLAYMQAQYGTTDTSLAGCAEFNAYRAFHVMGIGWAGAAFLLMSAAHVSPLLISPALLKRMRISSMVLAFMAGVSGVIAHCLFIDWWNGHQQSLVTLGYEGEVGLGTSTPSYVSLDHSFFDLTGGWVAALTSSLLYVSTFTPSPTTTK